MLLQVQQNGHQKSGHVPHPTPKTFIAQSTYRATAGARQTSAQQWPAVQQRIATLSRATYALTN
jgi:hypothetical protein